MTETTSPTQSTTARSPRVLRDGNKGRLPTRARKSHVYLIEADTNVVKIGRAADPKRRRSELQVGAAGPLALLHSWKMKNAEAAALERDLLRRFRYARTSGEWHKVQPEDVMAVGAYLVAGEVSAADALCAALVRASKAEGFEAIKAATTEVVRLGGGNEWDRAVFAVPAPL